ncbi:phospho-N-acetylmuramoyl-pentapeptide-transferase [Jeotgalibaca ciconiae]|uniref:Phospho-N-acetylmuramoyl-pentapeptide-transferase n=1 Tax=Jeotgalibaca ciconiae TaxID=2496265 RepID=A0A3Q9BMY1_9LACT|nr:phospho-N-acetylmuramoyl-pentapeptide-transferase [Jeotgalibaca ciconiae]AZP05090.1 phospho-N-acetylmuramoyl-pentapeptide-transferase [Jeotgalibaca ciconiae]HJB23223.1 phospho-N-acetylmuramoyl-pentapeptide-transferase [Candidatus Jeotgalibaca pullicola]
MHWTEMLIPSAFSFALTISILPIFIGYLRLRQFGQTTREEGPLWHEAKSGTPTMGGAVFIIAAILITIVTAVWQKVFNYTTIMLLVALLFFAAIGFWDDFIKIFKKQNEGLTSKQKFIAQLVGSGIFVILFYLSGKAPLITVPFIGQVENWLFFAAFTIIWITGFSNAVNLTDGLDGLVAGTASIAYAAYAYIAHVQGQTEILLFCLTIIGGLVGFFIFNKKPAKIFMGDVGSLALGAGLAVVSLSLHQEWSLLIIGLIFVIETASVILQVSSFKLRGKRIFKMSPIHHHFEMSGWSEWRVVITFWLVGLIAAIIGLLLVL